MLRSDLRFNMHWWTIQQLSRMREEELLKEAERVRLIRKSRSERRKLSSGYCALLNKLGKLLVFWGSHLQKHSEARLK